MEAKENQYPNLERYLKSWALSLRIQKLKRPEEWIRWIGIVAFGALLPFSWLAGLGVLIVTSVVPVLFLKLRGMTQREALRVALASGTRMRIQKAVRKGTLDGLVGTEAAAILESCSEFAMRSIQAVFRVRVLGPKLPQHYSEVMRDCNQAVEAEMTNTVQVLQYSIAFKGAPTAANLASLRAHEANLRSLAEESESFAEAIDSPKSEHDIRATLGRIRAIREAEQEINLPLDQR